jgi:DtxR family Mn-dependent transcriptional regulator
VLSALERFLDSPESCPHGHPIPDAALTGADTGGTPLSDLATGEKAKVVSLDERDESALTYLTRSGIVPDASVTLDSRNPVDGTLLVHVTGRRVTVGLDLAEHVCVSRMEE